MSLTKNKIKSYEVFSERRQTLLRYLNLLSKLTVNLLENMFDTFTCMSDYQKISLADVLCKIPDSRKLFGMCISYLKNTNNNNFESEISILRFIIKKTSITMRKFRNEINHILVNFFCSSKFNN